MLAIMLEVMDKEIPFRGVLMLALLPPVLGFLAARLKPWFLLIVIPAAVVPWCAHLCEVSDAFIGPAMLHEEGLTYVLLSWLGLPALILAVILGLVLRWRAARASSPGTSASGLEGGTPCSGA